MGVGPGGAVSGAISGMSAMSGVGGAVSGFGGAVSGVGGAISGVSAVSGLGGAVSAGMTAVSGLGGAVSAGMTAVSGLGGAVSAIDVSLVPSARPLSRAPSGATQAPPSHNERASGRDRSTQEIEVMAGTV